MLTQFIPTLKLFIGPENHEKSSQLLSNRYRRLSGPVLRRHNPRNSITIIRHFADQETTGFQIGCCDFWTERNFMDPCWSVTVVIPPDIKRDGKLR